MKFPVLWSGLCCYTEGWGGKCSEILATIKLLYNPRVNKVFTIHNSHVFQSCSQDSNAVLAIMEDVIGKLKAVMPVLRTVIYRQDNAGCYRSGATIIGASKAGQFHGVTVKRLDFSDPQAGKGACGRKAATIKAHMRIHLNEGNDIENAAQMVDAMRSSGGVPGLHVTLCEMTNPRTSANVKFDGVSGVSNVEYGEDCITTWKAYGIGPGKTVKLSKFTRSNNETPIPRLSLEMCGRRSGG